MGIRCLSGGRKHKGKTKEFGQRNEMEGPEGEVEIGNTSEGETGKGGEKRGTREKKEVQINCKETRLPE